MTVVLVVFPRDCAKEPFTKTSYPVMVKPPESVGALQDAETLPSGIVAKAVAVGLPGAEGTLVILGRTYVASIEETLFSQPFTEARILTDLVPSGLCSTTLGPFARSKFLSVICTLLKLIEYGLAFE